MWIIDWKKEIYSGDQTNEIWEVYAFDWEDKLEEDSESNQTINEILKAIEEQFWYILK